ncbi:hypothetical protein BQ9231_00426 [Cedratvirus lausannensis]|uniref:Uncharacterized protein n=2 Tax=Pithoviruses TaxID=2023203 RepID=A0A285PXG5_9VIRU|nr:hypothetical protein Cbor_202 [Cedratvirus borely]WIL03445.1 hypothetical protein Cplu_196 [Cedratvirus plubellavi]SOB74309.1 hypothetical protein BQ9231_00426 [Cedratvirus lausannensis]SPN79183.1 Hypothetical protein ZAZAV_205 [Cedratvirus Zaza IHUMI]
MEANVKRIWEAQEYKAPKHILAEVAILAEEGDDSWIRSKLLVIRDDQSIFTFMDSDGNVYYIASSKCYLDEGKYVCVGPLYVAPGPTDSQRIQYARKEILPVVFPNSSV